MKKEGKSHCFPVQFRENHFGIGFFTEQSFFHCLFRSDHLVTHSFIVCKGFYEF